MKAKNPRARALAGVLTLAAIALPCVAHAQADALYYSIKDLEASWGGLAKESTDGH